MSQNIQIILSLLGLITVIITILNIENIIQKLNNWYSSKNYKKLLLKLNNH